jgi:hypothetical protein
MGFVAARLNLDYDYPTDGLDLNGYRRFAIAGIVLHLADQLVEVGERPDGTVIGDTDEDPSARAIGEGAELSPEVVRE